MLKIIILSLIVIGAKSEPDAIQTKFGLLQGKWIKTSRNFFIDAYLGIPYAKPPVDDLRFKNPQIWEEKWLGTKEATKNGPTCIQIDSNGKISGEEDCLYLNVFVPTDTRHPTTTTDLAKRKLPVLIFIRGGSFNVGTTNSSIFSPVYLLNQQIVLVTFNYRLNFLGFYSTGNDASPGNYGLKDMVTVLKWVKANIEDFGGDPDSVTLFGNSAGAAAVHHLSLSKKTEGLFHKMITMSGSALAPWAFHLRKNIRNDSIELAKLANCFQMNETVTTALYNEITEASADNYKVDNITTNMTDEEIVDCMRNIDVKELLNLTRNMTVWKKSPNMIFGPTLEEDKEDAIITMHPRKVVESASFRDIPWITGVVADEGLGLGIDFEGESLQELEENFTELGPYVMECHQVIEKKEQFSQSLIDYYFQGNLSQNFNTNASQLFGDININWPVYEALQNQARTMKSSVYFYDFVYEGTFSVTMDKNGLKKSGVAHMDDLNYLFPFLNNMYAHLMLENTSDDKTMINIMTELWADFAKNGKPSANYTWTEWKPYQENHEFMRLGNGSSATISMERDFLAEKMKFWEQLLKDVSYPLDETVLISNNNDNDAGGPQSPVQAVLKLV
ncbi:esterase E4-like isoform X2 [Belonocnema kinseyi]|uniref:esterase E4-like isoform X2 n=1 Tax=Belonocnema kinseyi TaxID=2817044 RepID=UPI00143DADE5|nr:esterase E4-like isoform X2 [Belonocnema kinseyi]